MTHAHCGGTLTSAGTKQGRYRCERCGAIIKLGYGAPKQATPLKGRLS